MSMIVCLLWLIVCCFKQCFCGERAYEARRKWLQRRETLLDNKECKEGREEVVRWRFMPNSCLMFKDGGEVILRTVASGHESRGRTRKHVFTINSSNTLRKLVCNKVLLCFCSVVFSSSLQFLFQASHCS